MQASSLRWTPPTGFLGQVTLRARARAADLAPRRAFLHANATYAARVPAFATALRSSTVTVIAEIKRRSPTMGDIRPEIDTAEQAKAYERGGAAAISVLTEPEYFGGALADLELARAAVGLPILRKDFIVDPLQLFEARLAGASAALLIARALHPDEARDLLAAARDVGLAVLFEIRDERELEIGINGGAKIIGVNNRDLETLEIAEGHATRLIPLVPPELTAVAESGMRTADDVRRVAAAGADAVLIGSLLSAAMDPAAVLGELTAVPRMLRARH